MPTIKYILYSLYSTTHQSCSFLSGWHTLWTFVVAKNIVDSKSASPGALKCRAHLNEELPSIRISPTWYPTPVFSRRLNLHSACTPRAWLAAARAKTSSMAAAMASEPLNTTRGHQRGAAIKQCFCKPLTIYSIACSNEITLRSEDIQVCKECRRCIILRRAKISHVTSGYENGSVQGSQVRAYCKRGFTPIFLSHASHQRLICFWLFVSTLLVAWDSGFVLLRPRSMPGGDLHYLWKPCKTIFT